MSTPFLSGVLSLFAADEEVALIPPAMTAISALPNTKTALQRVAILAQLETNLLAAETGVGPTLLGQVAPQLNATLQALLTKAQQEVAAAATPPPA